MADVPSEVLYGEVVGRFVQFIADTSDPGNVPDEVPLIGTVTLKPSVTTIRFPTTSPPRLAVAQPAICRVLNGDLYPPGSDPNPGVWLIATNQPGGYPNKVQWTATFNLADIRTQPKPVIFEIPANGVIDLTLVVPVEAEPPVVTVVSHADAIAAQQAALDAQQAAAAAAASAEQAEEAATVGPPGPEGPQGPEGPEGPEGPPGTSTVALSYRHYQSTAADTWTITHPLSFRPSVTVADSTGREVWPGQVEYLNDTTIQLSFSAAFGGEAYLS